MKRKKLTIIVAIALALVMICGGIAIYAVGEANEKRIGGEDTAKVTAEASIEPEAKITAEPEAETNEDSQAKIPPNPKRWKAKTPMSSGGSFSLQIPRLISGWIQTITW